MGVQLPNSQGAGHQVYDFIVKIMELLIGPVVENIDEFGPRNSRGSFESNAAKVACVHHWMPAFVAKR